MTKDQRKKLDELVGGKVSEWMQDAEARELQFHGIPLEELSKEALILAVEEQYHTVCLREREIEKIKKDLHTILDVTQSSYIQHQLKKILGIL